MAQATGSGPPPHDSAAEDAILGASLFQRSALEVLATKLRPADFYVPGNQSIAASLTRLFEAGTEVDSIIVADDLKRRGEIDAAGGMKHLIQLLDGAPVASGAGRWAEIVHDHATARRLMGSALEILDGARTPGNVHDLVVRAQALVGDVASNNGSRTYSSLVRADVSSIVAGDFVLDATAFLTRTDGRALLYAGKMHVLQADPSVGKTWLALLACLEILALGGAVVFIDYEDTAGGVIGRLLSLGAVPEDVAERFAYVHFDGPIGTSELLELDRILQALNPDLVVIDGVAEALARDGYDEDKNADVVRWTERVPRPIARTGAAVLMLDHLAKNKETRGRNARGAGHKLAAVDGAAYELIVVTPFSRQTPGKFRLRVAKDRPGAVGEIGSEAAVAHLEPHADGTRVVMRLEPPTAIAERLHTKPTIVMGMISNALEGSKVPVSATVLRNLLATSKPKIVDSALAHLKADGYVDEVRRGRATFLRLVTPYAGPVPSSKPAGPPQLHLVEPVPDDPDDDRPKL